MNDVVWLGWIFMFLGLAFILVEVYFRFRPKKAKKLYADVVSIPDTIITELIKKLPWVVVLGLIFIYLGLTIIHAPVPIKIAIGG